MSIDTQFIVPEDARISFIDDHIVGKLPKPERESAKERATRIVTDYVGQDMHALSVLAYAAERGRFDEFAGKLEVYYRGCLQHLRPVVRSVAKDCLHYVHPSARESAWIRGAILTEQFFFECYVSLEINAAR